MTVSAMEPSVQRIGCDISNENHTPENGVCVLYERRLQECDAASGVWIAAER